MENVSMREEDIKNQCRAHLAKPSEGAGRGKRNFLVLKDGGFDSSFAVKIASGFDKWGLEYDLAFMQFFEQYSSSKKYTVPIGYGIIEDDGYSYLVMQNVRGKTIWEVMDNGGQRLSDDDADAIAAAIVDMRADQGLSQLLTESNSLTPLCHWYPESPIFGYDNDGGRRVNDWTDFEKFMTVRFKEAGVDLEVVPLSPRVITHGELSPHNLKKCPDGSIGILDLRTAFAAPPWWEFYAIHSSKEDLNFAEPLMRAMIRHGMGIGDKTREELDNKFRPWFARLGGSFAR